MNWPTSWKFLSDKITDTMRVAGKHVSMDAPFVNGEDNSLLDVIENSDSPKADNLLMSESLQKEIDRSLSTLTDREREVIKLFFRDWGQPRANP
jgi:RNA polymerase primary sigma factor